MQHHIHLLNLSEGGKGKKLYCHFYVGTTFALKIKLNFHSLSTRYAGRSYKAIDIDSIDQLIE